MIRRSRSLLKKVGEPRYGHQGPRSKAGRRRHGRSHVEESQRRRWGPAARNPKGARGLRPQRSSILLRVALLRVVVSPTLSLARPSRAAAPTFFNRLLGVDLPRDSFRDRDASPPFDGLGPVCHCGGRFASGWPWVCSAGLVGTYRYVPKMDVVELSYRTGEMKSRCRRARRIVVVESSIDLPPKKF